MVQKMTRQQSFNIWTEKFIHNSGDIRIIYWICDVYDYGSYLGMSLTFLI